MYTTTVLRDQRTGKFPYRFRGGEIKDISHLLRFRLFEPVLYKSDENFPHSNELPDYFVGFSENVGDAFCYKILKQDMKSILHRSVVRSAEDPSRRNRRVHFNNITDDILEKKDEILGMPRRTRHKKRRPPKNSPVFNCELSFERLLLLILLTLSSSGRLSTSSTTSWYLNKPI